jgi:hypothetical protein
MPKTGLIHFAAVLNSQPNLLARFNKEWSYAKQLRSFDKQEASKPKGSYLKIRTSGDYYQKEERTCT